MNKKKPINVQIAFQGGGAKLYALIAAAKAIKELEEDKAIKVNRVAGSSAGAIIASLYAAGVDIDKAIDVFSNLPAELKEDEVDKVKELFDLKKGFFRKAYRIYTALNRIKKKKPLLDIDEKILEDKLNEFKEIRDIKISDLKKIKLIITRTDIKRNENKCKESDYVIDALLQSCRIPFLFKTKNDDHFDGGITVNLPTNLLTQDIDDYGYVIAISFKEDIVDIKDGLDMAFVILMNVFNAGVNINKNDKRVCVIDVACDDVSVLNFNKMSEIFKEKKKNPLSEDTVFDNVYKQVKEKLDIEFIKTRVAVDYSIKCRHENLITNVPSVKKYQKQYSPVLIRYKYTDLSSVESMQSNVEKYLKKIGWETVEQQQDKYFDALQRPEIAILNKAIYTFPFLMSRLRRNYWGVIDYGAHRAIGVLLKNNSPLKSYIIDHVYDPARPNEMISTFQKHWMCKIIESMNSANVEKEIITVNGYLYNEMLPLMILERGQFSSIDALIKMPSYVRDQNMYRYDVENQEINKIINKYMGENKVENSFELMSSMYMFHDMIERLCDDKDGYSILVYDLSYKKIIRSIVDEKNVSSKIEDFNLHHYLDIMVGIGFSLPAYSDIIGEKWESMQSEAFDTLSGSKDELSRIGIILNNN